MVTALKPLTKPWPIEIKIAPGKGVGVFAKKRIKQGTVFFTESPDLRVFLDDTRCYHCVRKLTASMEAVGCGEGCPKQYCSVECRDRAMELYHAPLCHYHHALEQLEVYAANGRNGTSRIPLLSWKMLGMALQQRKPGQKYLSVAPADVFPYIHLARNSDAPAGMEHDHNISTNALLHLQVWECIHECADFGGDPLLGLKWLLDATMVCLRNGISLAPEGLSDSLANRGQAVMLPGTMFNHACAPNATYHSPVNNKIEFFAIENVEAGEEITISYCSCDAPVADRQAVLQAMYAFTCDCKKCKAEMKTA